MMKYLFSGLFIFLIASCSHNNGRVQTKSVISSSDSTRADTSFFPVTSYIEGQMLSFDSIPESPLHITIIDNKNDSQWIKREALKSFLQPFIETKITEKNLLNYFKETQFNDQTIDAITLAYDPITSLPDSIDLRS